MDFGFEISGTDTTATVCDVLQRLDVEVSHKYTGEKPLGLTFNPIQARGPIVPLTKFTAYLQNGLGFGVTALGLLL